MDLGVQFFTAAKTQHESGTKWSLIVLVILLYFHLAIVGPFAQQMAAKAEIERDLARFRRIEAEVAPIVASVATFVAAVESQVKEASTGLRQDLIDRFRIVDEKIRILSMLRREQAEGEVGARLFERDDAAMVQQQQQPIAPDDLTEATLEPMPPHLRGLVAEASQNATAMPQYSEQMEHYINAFVIAPAFQRANEAWTTKILPALTDDATQLDADIEAALPESGSAADQLDTLRAAVAALLEEARRLAFAPPADPSWWRSVAGKESSIHAMVEAMIRGAGKIGEQQLALEAAQDKASAAIAENEQRAKEVADRLTELEQESDELQAQLGGIGEPLKVISVRLSVLAPLLPLIIALAIAALSVWRAESLRRMRFAAGLVESDSAGEVPRRWLRSAAGGSARSLAAREIGIAAAAAAWVMAAWHNVRPLPSPYISDVAMAGVTLAILAAARAYHWYESHRALAFAAR